MYLALSFHPGWILSFLSFGLLAGWFLWSWARKSEDPPGVLTLKIIATLTLGSLAIWVGATMHPIIGIPLAAAIAIIIGILWGRNVGAAIANPLSSLYDGGKEEPDRRPFYAIAEAHRKQARFDDALLEIRKQLDLFPGDVEGLLKVAEIQCRNLHDWTAAAAAIDEIVLNAELPNATRAMALHAFSDWRLELKGDTAAAADALRRIQSLFPDTQEAFDAARRLAHVGDAAWRHEKRSPRQLQVTAADPHLGLRSSDSVSAPAAPPAADPEIEVQALLTQLNAHPLDSEAREKLARIYAESLGRADWAIGEVEKLIALPGQPARQVARWYHLLADIHVRCHQDEESARQALKRILETFPGSAVATVAQSRIEVLKVEIKGQHSG